MMISIVDEIETNFVVNETISLPTASTIEAVVAIGAMEGKMNIEFDRESVQADVLPRLFFFPFDLFDFNETFFAEIGRTSTDDNIRAVAAR